MKWAVCTSEARALARRSVCCGGLNVRGTATRRSAETSRAAQAAVRANDARDAAAHFNPGTTNRRTESQQRKSKARDSLFGRVGRRASSSKSGSRTVRSSRRKSPGQLPSEPTYDLLREADQKIEKLSEQAQSFEFHGYFRSGYGLNSKGGAQVAFQAPGADVKYRLGNEAETYGEFYFRQQLAER
jgi:maltoporin